MFNFLGDLSHRTSSMLKNVNILNLPNNIHLPYKKNAESKRNLVLCFLSAIVNNNILFYWEYSKNIHKKNTIINLSNDFI